MPLGVVGAIYLSVNGKMFYNITLIRVIEAVVVVVVVVIVVADVVMVVVRSVYFAALNKS